MKIVFIVLWMENCAEISSIKNVETRNSVQMHGKFLSDAADQLGMEHAT